MADNKFDKRLVAEIAKIKKKIDSKKTTAAKAMVPVIIEHIQKASIPKNKSKNETIIDVKKEVSKLQKNIVDKLENLGVKRVDIKQLWIANAISATLTIEQIEKTAELDDVKIIRLEKVDDVFCLNESVPMIRVPSAWDMGYTGKGVKVAILDSGIDKNHPALASKIIDEFDTSGEGVEIPGGNHGTLVAGIVASNDATYRGVAYNASLINGKVGTASGASIFGVMTGIQEAIIRGADVINMSFGWSHILQGWNCPDGHCVLCQAADNCVEMGIIVVIGAGNEDNQASAAGADTNIRCPGNSRGAITVGAMDKKNLMAGFSSRGPTPYKAVKPDICAPGVSIWSTTAGGGWNGCDGTSFSTPHVTGLAALLLEKHPHLVCQDVKHILMTTALNRNYGENHQGTGRVNALMGFKYFIPASKKVDVYVRDYTYDIGDAPHKEPSWQSPDIWGQLIQNGKEEYGIVEPNEEPEFGQDNYIFVRIHNRGAETANSVSVHLSVAGFSTYPGGWEDIGTIAIQNILAGQTRVVGPYLWSPSRIKHGCFKVGLDYGQQPLPTDWKVVEVGLDNNIAQRNIDVVDLLPNGTAQINFSVNGLVGEKAVGGLEIDRSLFPKAGVVKARVPRRYVNEGEKLSGIKIEGKSVLKAFISITSNVGKIEGIPLQSREMPKTYVFATLPSNIIDGGTYPIVVTQKIDSKVVGRITFNITASKEAPYIINSNPKCKEVHEAGCVWAKKIKNKYKRPIRSLEELMQKGFPSADKYDGCKYCLPEYHLK